MAAKSHRKEEPDGHDYAAAEDYLYHRICASYRLNEDEDIPCRIVDASKS